MGILSYLAGAYRHFMKFGSPGIALYRKKNTRAEKLVEIHPPQIRYPVYLRTNSSDIGIFDQVFLLDFYKFDYGTAPATIIDCGANVGMATVFFKNAFPDARVIAVEPDPANFALLERNAGKYEGVTCLQMGIWNKTGILEINNRHFNNNSGFMVEEVAERRADSIDAISIDGIMERFGLSSIDVLKVDIEGAEKEVFQANIEAWLPKVKLLIIETHDFMKPGCARAVFSALNDYDYSLGFSGESFFIRLGGRG